MAFSPVNKLILQPESKEIVARRNNNVPQSDVQSEMSKNEIKFKKCIGVLHCSSMFSISLFVSVWLLVVTSWQFNCKKTAIKVDFCHVSLHQADMH